LPLRRSGGPSPERGRPHGRDRNRFAARLDRAGARPRPAAGAPRPHLLARPRRARPRRPGHERARPLGRVRPARDRPRPHGSRLGRLPHSRDRGDAGRERRDRRLARPLRSPQRRARRELGGRREWRRGRRRPLHPLRDGRRRGWKRARRAEDQARLLDGSRARCRALRRRRLPGGAGRGEAARPVSFHLERRLGANELAEQLRREAREGLTASPKRMRSRWVWDGRGSELYGQIMELPQYSLPGAEREILAARAGEIDALVRPRRVVELGPGSSVKTPLLLDGLAGLERYVAIDVSEDALQAAGHRLAERYPGLEIVGIVGDFETGLPGHEERTLALCLGSTIGGLDPEDRAVLLTAVAAMLSD